MPDNNWTIRPYEPGDEERIVSFFNSTFDEYDGFEPRSVEFWRWQFARNPLGHRHCIAEDRDGRIIGNYAGIQTPYVCRGDRYVGSQCVDTCIAPEYRGTGLFIELANAFFERYGNPENDFIQFGYPNPPAFKVGSRHLGYRPVHCPVEKLFKDVDEDWVAEIERAAEAVVVTQSTRVDDRFDDLWQRRRGDYTFATLRDQSYLRWRYDEHPSIDYHYLTATDAGGELIAMLVFRHGWFADRVTPLVDWLLPRSDRRTFFALLAAAARQAHATGHPRLETWAPPGSPERAHLVATGFVGEETQFNLMIKTYDPVVDAEWAAENWFYGMGDADFY